MTPKEIEHLRTLASKLLSEGFPTGLVINRCLDAIESLQEELAEAKLPTVEHVQAIYKIGALESEKAKLTEQVRSQSSQIDGLIERGNKLVRYVEHKPNCGKAKINFPYDGSTCCCELDDLLKGAP